jgi:hypothetical protein
MGHTDTSHSNFYIGTSHTDFEASHTDNIAAHTDSTTPASHTNISHQNVTIPAAHTNSTTPFSNVGFTNIGFNNSYTPHTNIAHSNIGFTNIGFSNSYTPFSNVGFVNTTIPGTHTNIAPSHTDNTTPKSHTDISHTNIGAAHTNTTINNAHTNSTTLHQNVPFGAIPFVNSYTPAVCSECPGGFAAECDEFCECFPNCGCQDFECVAV